MLSDFDLELGKKNNLNYLLDINETICKNCGANVEGKDTCPNCKQVLSCPWWKRPRSWHYQMKLAVENGADPNLI